MARDEREPQSYGSGKDWVTGKTGQQVNEQKSTPRPEHRDFYDERRESETSSPDQGGRISEVQLAESAEPAGRPTGDDSPISKITTETGGAKRDSYFKKRDYE